MIINARDNPAKFTQNLKRENFISHKIRFEYETSSSASDISFYTMSDKCLMLKGSNLSVNGDLSDRETEDLMIFCSFAGVETIETCQKSLPLYPGSTLNLLRRTEKFTVLHNVEPSANESIYAFAEFCRGNFQGINRDSVYPYFARAVNHGRGKIYTVKNDGQIVSGGFRANYGNYIYITFLSTKENYRGQGLARTVIKAVMEDNNGREIRLICENKLLSFYESLNFVKTDEIYVYNIKE